LSDRRRQNSFVKINTISIEQYTISIIYPIQ
jgi:hypothetical protein